MTPRAEAPLPPVLRTVFAMLAVTAIAALLPALVPLAAAATPPSPEPSATKAPTAAKASTKAGKGAPAQAPTKRAKPPEGAKPAKAKPGRAAPSASTVGLPDPETSSVFPGADPDDADPGDDAEQTAEAADDAADVDPWATLAAARPELADALAARLPEERLAGAATLLAAADPRLVDLLLPLEPGGAYPDRTGEDVRVDLVQADIRLEGTHLVGWVEGVGVVDNGIWLDLDTRSGPAPDLRLGLGRGWSREATLDGGGPSPFLARDAVPELGEDWLGFDVDLAGSERFDPDHAGSVVASVKSFDGSVSDVGPGGFLGAPPLDALEVLAAELADGPVEDADLAVALAITFGAMRAQVEDAVTPTVDADAVAWLRYGEGLDAWLEEHGAEWRFSDQDAFAKLVWAWPAAQSVAYGAFPLAGQATPLTAARYRFVVPSAEQLGALRDRVPLQPTAAGTADSLERELWRHLAYRTNDDLMRTLCANGGLETETCQAWRAESVHGVTLGTVDGVKIAPSDGVSAGFQLDLMHSRGSFVGDCAVETSLAIWELQALGIPAIGMGWAGSDTATPTHDVPLWLDGDTFRATQAGPSRDWAAEAAYVYVTLPGVHPVNAFTIGREPNGWSRGGAIAGGWTKFAEVRRILSGGLPASIVGGWVDVEGAGGWPTW